MRNSWLRIAHLEAKASVLHLGPWPWLGLALFLGAAWIQEPSFFRQQGLDLAWPAASAAADVLPLLFVLQLVMSSHRTSSVHPVARVLAVLGFGLMALAAASVCGLMFDLALRRPTPWAEALPTAVRSMLLWSVVGCVAASPRLLQQDLAQKLMWVAGAFGVQAAVLPPEDPIWQRSPQSWLAVLGTLAAGSALLTSPRPSRARGDSPCA